MQSFEIFLGILTHSAIFHSLGFEGRKKEVNNLQLVLKNKNKTLV